MSRWVCCSSQWKTGQRSRETKAQKGFGVSCFANLEVQLAASEVWRWPCIAWISGRDCQGFWLLSFSEFHMFHCSTKNQRAPKAQKEVAEQHAWRRTFHTCASFVWRDHITATSQGRTRSHQGQYTKIRRGRGNPVIERCEISVLPSRLRRTPLWERLQDSSTSSTVPPWPFHPCWSSSCLAGPGFYGIHMYEIMFSYVFWTQGMLLDLGASNYFIHVTWHVWHDMAQD